MPPSRAAALCVPESSCAPRATHSLRMWQSRENRPALRSGCSFFDPEGVGKNLQFAVRRRDDLLHDEGGLELVELLQFADHFVDPAGAGVAITSTVFLNDQPGDDKIVQRLDDDHAAAAQLLDHFGWTP